MLYKFRVIMRSFIVVRCSFFFGWRFGIRLLLCMRISLRCDRHGKIWEEPHA